MLDVRADAEDVTAAAFLELWRRRESVRLVDGSVLPWLLVTTSNLSRNARRSTRRYRALLGRLPRAGAAPDPAEVMLGAAPAGWDDALVTHLRDLNRADQALITLVALEGFTVSEAAEALGISLAAAKSRLHRIRRRPRLRRPTPENPTPERPDPEMPPAFTSEGSHP
jgi:RNA polymerase sigma-70 factor (ECF subfamily)